MVRKLDIILRFKKLKLLLVSIYKYAQPIWRVFLLYENLGSQRVQVGFHSSLWPSHNQPTELNECFFVFTFLTFIDSKYGKKDQCFQMMNTGMGYSMGQQNTGLLV